MREQTSPVIIRQVRKLCKKNIVIDCRGWGIQIEISSQPARRTSFNVKRGLGTGSQKKGQLDYKSCIDRSKGVPHSLLASLWFVLVSPMAIINRNSIRKVDLSASDATAERNRTPADTFAFPGFEIL